MKKVQCPFVAPLGGDAELRHRPPALHWWEPADIRVWGHFRLLSQRLDCVANSKLPANRCRIATVKCCTVFFHKYTLRCFFFSSAGHRKFCRDGQRHRTDAAELRHWAGRGGAAWGGQSHRTSPAGAHGKVQETQSKVLQMLWNTRHAQCHSFKKN